MKERTIRIKFIYNSDLENKAQDFLKKADILPYSSIMGVVRTGIITTENSLPLDEYRQLIEKAFEKNGGRLLEMSEVAPN